MGSGNDQIYFEIILVWVLVSPDLFRDKPSGDPGVGPVCLLFADGKVTI